MRITGARFWMAADFSVLAELLAPEARVNSSWHQAALSLVERKVMNKKEKAIAATTVRAAVFAALIGLAAGCSSSPPGSGSPSATAPPSSAAAATAPASAAAASASAPAGMATAGPATASASASAAGFVGMVEPFDPGHPARTEPAPADCYSQPSTASIDECFETRTENTDAAIDAVQQARYDAASPAGRAAILAQDSAWLAARGPVCQVAFHSGGSVDEINTGACLLQESTARLDAVKGIAPPEAMLKSTDSPDPSALSWYTTPDGSRIAELDTQGDQSGGGIIAWIIIGGADGFVVNPSQFYFSDGSFTDPGIIQPPSPAYHRVGTGHQYQFLIDYSHLSAAPTDNPAAGFVYAPGTPVAIWQ
jgi:uncharacterized protein YecT (DUF1311 family)